ncbi:MAG: NADP-dependent phosphogluconate dehydrogenase, partial [Pyrinomonadaceae bacterium]|nr:NADP-dependent phosphogluconate dehydrogenase [Pyrinomonadaceae bacterium]
MAEAKFGMIGLGTMGRNFLLNVAEQGFSTAGYDLDAAKRELLLAEGRGFEISVGDDLPSFRAQLERPRNIMLLVPAGPIVDAVIEQLIPMLEPGDLVIDGGNSHFTDTERREKYLNEKGFEFLGVGVSGGEEGARHGASIMIGGNPEVYERVRPIFEAASAKVGGEPCAAHVGKGSAGHFVKMVHNGIEYAMMQLIAEAYDLLKRSYGMSAAEIGGLFAEWNAAELNSFLMEISATVLQKRDAETGDPLVEMILDTAGQKGTGKWTSQAAMDLGVPIPSIDSAVTMRQISARKAERVAAAELLNIVMPLTVADELKKDSIEFVRAGLHLSFIISYAQGLSLLRAASDEKGYELDMVEIAKIWRGGCIIRAAMLEDIREAFAAEPALANILYSPKFRETVRLKQSLLKAFVHFAASTDVPCMAAAASLNYPKSLATDRLPANLIQAQRDYFGAHTYPVSYTHLTLPTSSE